MSEWIESKIDELTSDIIDCVNKTAPSVGYVTPYKMIRTTNVKEGRLNVSEVKYVEEEVFIKWTRRGTLRKNDILLTREAPLGEIARITNETNYFLGQRLVMYRPDITNVDPDFLFYAMLGREVKYQIKAFGMGSTVEHMRVPDCSELVIKHPKNIEEQAQIGKTLSNLDKKISLLRQLNKDLEELAQTLFKRWFVEFEFPNENGAPYKSSGGKMVESELGEIPEGWRVTQLKELADKISKGTTPRKNEVDGLELDVPFIKVKDITDDGQIKFGDIESIPSSVHIGSLKRSILNRNDILFSIAGTIGRVTIVPEDLNNSNCNQAVAFIRLKGIQHLELIHQWFKSQSVQNEINASIVQGVQANVSLGVLGNLLINIPSAGFIEKWNAVIKPIYEKCNNCSNEIQTLTQLRDTLLPKLMSGEIRLNTIKED